MKANLGFFVSDTGSVPTVDTIPNIIPTRSTYLLSNLDLTFPSNSVHWGVFSVPGIKAWIWEFWQDNSRSFGSYINQTERPNFAYQEYATRFTADLYNPEYWAQTFANSGAQYVVLTSKHHEGYCMWDSRDVPTTWNWNVMDIGPRRDLLGDLAKAVKNVTSPYTNRRLKFGVYHSLFEFYNPAYINDKNSNFTTQKFVKTKTIPELYDLVQKYEPELLWSDGSWDAHSDYWTSKEFLAWYATNSTVNTTGVWNDRWGNESVCSHGSYLTCNDRYRPDQAGGRKWENCDTVDRKSWVFDHNSTIEDYHTSKELVDTLIQTVSYGGNFLLNVGPSADGTLDPIFVDRLFEVGKWLKVNGMAIYETKSWEVAQNETNTVFYTRRKEALFAIVTKWPNKSILTLAAPNPTHHTKVAMLGFSDEQFLDWSTHKGGIRIVLPSLTPGNIPCDHAWVLKLTSIANLNAAGTKVSARAAG